MCSLMVFRLFSVIEHVARLCLALLGMKNKMREVLLIGLISICGHVNR